MPDRRDDHAYFLIVGTRIRQHGWLTVHTEHLGHAEAIDVGVENPHLVSHTGQRDGQVHRGGALAHPTLAGRNSQDPGLGAHLHEWWGLGGARGMTVATSPGILVVSPALSQSGQQQPLLVHGEHLQRAMHRGDTRECPHGPFHQHRQLLGHRVFLHLGGHHHVDCGAGDVDMADQVQFGDGQPELGLIDGAQGHQNGGFGEACGSGTGGGCGGGTGHGHSGGRTRQPGYGPLPVTWAREHSGNHHSW